MILATRVKSKKENLGKSVGPEGLEPPTYGL